MYIFQKNVLQISPNSQPTIFAKTQQQLNAFPSQVHD
jgi:hypothetical protein